MLNHWTMMTGLAKTSLHQLTPSWCPGTWARTDYCFKPLNFQVAYQHRMIVAKVTILSQQTIQLWCRHCSPPKETQRLQEARGNATCPVSHMSRFNTWGLFCLSSPNFYLLHQTAFNKSLLGEWMAEKQPTYWAKDINCTCPNSYLGPDHLKARKNSSMYPKRLIFLLWDICYTKTLPNKWIPFMPGWRWGIRERKNLHGAEIITVFQGPWQADALHGPAGGVKDATSGGSQWAVHEALI